MKSNFRMALLVGIMICGIRGQHTCQAQGTTAKSEKVDFISLASSARVVGEPTELIASAKSDGAVNPAVASASPAAATPAPAVASSSSAAASPGTIPLNSDAVIKELVEMKARIAQLEAELKARSSSDDAASAERDADALRSSEGNAADGSSSAAEMQTAPVPPAAAAPAAPEIDAQVTTKGEPFSGDWTWLNSNGHAVDSPMSTKYFTPEFRADANYILDYNHPHDDSMGGATESFRSDEWQLEQISIG